MRLPIMRFLPPRPAHTKALRHARESLRGPHIPECWYRSRSSAMAFVDHGTDAVPIRIAGQALTLGGDRLQAKTAAAGKRTLQDHPQPQFENFANGHTVTRRIGPSLPE